MKQALAMLAILISVFCLPMSAKSKATASWSCPTLSIPNRIVQAMIEVESRSNPLALGAMIDGYHLAFYPEDLVTAKRLLQSLLKRTENIGIGLMQVNYFHHIKGTPIDPVSLFDPVHNRELGCRILGKALEGSGTLWEGIGRYHSQTPGRSRHYAIAVLQKALKGFSDEKSCGETHRCDPPEADKE